VTHGDDEASAAAEAIERDAYRALLSRVGPAGLRDRLGARAEDCGPALILRSPGIDHVLFNRSFGVDAAGPASAILAESVVARYRAQRIGRYFLHLHAERPEPAVREALAVLGLVRYPRVWHRFVRGRERVALRGGAFSVGPAQPGEAVLLATLLARGFDLPEPAVALLAAAVEDPAFRGYAARDASGRPVAALLLHARGDLAHVTATATDPAHRGLGAQAALIAQALSDALDAGCRQVSAETGAPIADEPNPSYRNLERAGFRFVHAIEHWAERGVRFGA
jgi:GNAT superfamily N-acetyltransferase